MPGTNKNSSYYDEEEKKNQQTVPQNGTPGSHYVSELTPIEDESNNENTNDTDGTTDTKKNTVVTPTPTTTDTYLKRRQEISDKYAKQAAGYDKVLADIQAELDQQKGKRRKEERLQALQATLDGITDFARVMNDIDTANHYVPYTAPKYTLSDKSRERAEKLKAAHDKDRALLMNYYDKVLNRKNALASQEYKEQSIALNEQKALQKAENDNALRDSRIKANEALARAREAAEQKNYELAAKYHQQYENEVTRGKYLAMGFDDNHAKAMAYIGNQNAAADKNSAQAEYYKNKEDGYTTVKEETDARGRKKVTTTTKTPSGSNASGNGKGTGKQAYTQQPATKKIGYSFK
jgi:hypothetical protein